MYQRKGFSFLGGDGILDQKSKNECLYPFVSTNVLPMSVFISVHCISCYLEACSSENIFDGAAGCPDSKSVFGFTGSLSPFSSVVFFVLLTIGLLYLRIGKASCNQLQKLPALLAKILQQEAHHQPPWH